MKFPLLNCSVVLFWCFSLPSFALDLNENLMVNFVTEANYYPFEYLDEKNQIQGFDIDIANAVCTKANLTCTFNSQRFDSLLLTLRYGRFDAVIAALDITEQRKESIDFSNPYYQSPPVFISAIDAREQHSISGKSIGVQSDSSNHRYLIEHAEQGSFIIAYRTALLAFSDLNNGVIDLVFTDQAVASNFLEEGSNKLNFSVAQVTQLPLENFSSGYGIAVKKGNVKLLERFNYGIKKIQEDGTYQQIIKRYFSH